jgi:ribose transport system substrate-binding protein
MVRRLFLSLVPVAVLGVCGCGPAKEAGDGAGVPAASGGGETKTVGVSLTSRNHNFFIGMEQGVTDALKEAGYEMDVQVAEDSATKQQEQIDQFILKKVDAIVMVPADAKQAANAVAAANKANIPIFCIDRRVTDPSATVTATIETDNAKMGEEAARHALKLLCERRKLDPANPEDVKKLRTTIVHNWGIQAASSAQDRARGMESVFNATATPGVKVITVVGEFNAKKSQEVTAPVLKANPDVELVLCHNDDNAIGALNAILDVKGARGDAADPKRILIVSIDGNKPAIEAIRKGDIEATVSQEPIEMGSETVKQVKKVLEGSQPDSQYIPIRYHTVTRKEADELKGKLWADQLRGGQ